MSQWQDRKAVLVSLGIAAVAVWVAVVHTVVSKWPTAEATPVIVQAEAAPEVRPIVHEWGGNFRDPFSGTAPQAATARSERAQQPESVRPETIRLRLIGIVDGTAMVETATGAVVLAKRGDSVDNARISDMTTSTVTLRYRGDTITLSLDSVQ